MLYRKKEEPNVLVLDMQSIGWMTETGEKKKKSCVWIMCFARSWDIPCVQMLMPSPGSMENSHMSIRYPCVL